MYRAAAAGEIDVISAYTSDGRMAQYDLVVLDDPKSEIPPYDAILLIARARADDPSFLILGGISAEKGGGSSVSPTARSSLACGPEDRPP
jgi:hypothetical protein